MLKAILHQLQGLPFVGFFERLQRSSCNKFCVWPPPVTKLGDAQLSTVNGLNLDQFKFGSPGPKSLLQKLDHFLNWINEIWVKSRDCWNIRGRQKLGQVYWNLAFARRNLPCPSFSSIFCPVINQSFTISANQKLFWLLASRCALCCVSSSSSADVASVHSHEEKSHKAPGVQRRGTSGKMDARIVDKPPKTVKKTICFADSVVEWL